jgi:hypothetical protein
VLDLSTAKKLQRYVVQSLCPRCSLDTLSQTAILLRHLRQFFTSPLLVRIEEIREEAHTSDDLPNHLCENPSQGAEILTANKMVVGTSRMVNVMPNSGYSSIDQDTTIEDINSPLSPLDSNSSRE